MIPRIIVTVFAFFVLVPFHAYAVGPTASIPGLNLDNGKGNYMVNLVAEQGSKRIIPDQDDTHGRALEEAAGRAIGAAATLGAATAGAGLSRRFSFCGKLRD